MNKKLIIRVLVLAIIALAVSFWFWQKNTQKSVEEVVVNQEQKTDEIDLLSENLKKVDTSDWETYCDQLVGYCFKYPADRYEVENFIGKDQMIVSNHIKQKNASSTVMMFFSNALKYEPRRSATFNDFRSYEKRADGYYALYSDKDKKVEVLREMEDILGGAIVIDGTKFDYSGPSLGPNEDFAAIINWQDNGYEGINVTPKDGLIDYDTFITILKSVHSILDIGDWKTYRNEDYGFEIKYPYSVILEEADVDDKIFFKFSDISGHFWILIKNNGSRLNAESIAENYQANDEYGYSYEESFVVINDIKSYKQGRYDSGVIENFYIPREDKIYQINFEFNFNTSDVELKREIEKMISKINSTFKFVE